MALHADRGGDAVIFNGALTRLHAHWSDAQQDLMVSPAAPRAEIDRVNWLCELRRCCAASDLGCRRWASNGLEWVLAQIEEAIFPENDTNSNREPPRGTPELYACLLDNAS